MSRIDKKTRAYLISAIILAVPSLSIALPLMFPAAPIPRYTSFSFDDYSIRISHEKPFGIVSLRLRRQPRDFSHDRWPLGNWQWFWIFRDRPKLLQVRTKHLLGRWEKTEERRSENGRTVFLSFAKKNAGLWGADLAVRFALRTDRPEFEIAYSVHNRTRRKLTGGWMMIGFPGFPNGAISSVGNRKRTRSPKRPHSSFSEEARARQKKQGGKRSYYLIRDAASNRELLKGSIAQTDAGALYLLEATARPGPGAEWGKSNCTNEPRYVACHLMVALRDIPPGGRYAIKVRYRLSRKARGRTPLTRSGPQHRRSASSLPREK